MQKVYFYNGRKQKLAAVLDKAGTKGVILSHGFASKKESMSEFSNFFRGNGYTTLAFDYSGHGESEGKLEETTITRWSDDLNSAVDFLSKDCREIALFGFSLGGMSSLVCSGRSTATIAIAPPTNFKKLAVHFVNTGLIKKLDKFIDFGGLKVGQEFITESAKYDMKDVMREIRCPILIIHGSDDDVIPLEHSQEAMAYINEPKKLVLIEGFGHGSANKDQMRIIYSEIAEWLKKYMAT